jgi:uncharacterized protein (TIGR03083 family)
MNGVVPAFFEAAEAFSVLLDVPAVAKDWDGPSALEGYTVGGIVGHVNAAVGWLEPLLQTAAPAEARPIRPGRYYAGMKLDRSGEPRHPMHDVVRDMSEKAALLGPEANTSKFRSLISRLQMRLPGESHERVLDLAPTLPIFVRLVDFLTTRIVELVVHADDLAVSIGAAAPLPEEAAAVVIEALVKTARAAHGDTAVLRALTRRERSSGDVFPVF